MIAKHSKEWQKIRELEDTIRLRDKEIMDIKRSIVDILQVIRDINEANTYSDESVRKRKISEICTDISYELLIDEVDTYEERQQKAKIIELPTTVQSNK